MDKIKKVVNELLKLRDESDYYSEPTIRVGEFKLPSYIKTKYPNLAKILTKYKNEGIDVSFPKDDLIFIPGTEEVIKKIRDDLSSLSEIEKVTIEKYDTKFETSSSKSVDFYILFAKVKK